MEFEQKVAEKKQPKPRKPRIKKDTNKSVTEVEARLQELMLEIEGGTCSFGQNYRLIDEPMVNMKSKNEELNMTENRSRDTGRSFSGQNYQLIDEPLVNMRSNIEEANVTENHSCDIDTEISRCSSGQNYRLMDEPLVNMRSYIEEVNKTENRSCDIQNEAGRCFSGQNYRLIDEPLVNNTRSNMEKVNVTKNRSCDTETEVVNLSTPLVMKSNRNDKTQMVDLVSPFSVVCRSKSLAIDVIDLSESDMEVSPEHAKKARELRLFVAKIRDDSSW